MHTTPARSRPMPDDARATLDRFLATSRFAEAGGVITDLDGTAVLEHEGRVRVAPEVEFGLKHLSDLGRPVAINTLRFPLNVIRTFGRGWGAITPAPLPLVSLNGAITGNLVHARGDTVVFEEIDAVPLTEAELAEVTEGVRGLVEGGVDDLLLFHYPRDWTAGELIWAPTEARADAARSKYRSASEVFSCPLAELEARLAARQHCMIFLLVDIPADRRMAYQHAKPSSFVTHNNLDKLDGAKRLAGLLGFDLAESVGCGDTPMDSFMRGCGLAVHVGPLDLEHKGLAETIKVPDAAALGRVLALLAQVDAP